MRVGTVINRKSLLCDVFSNRASCVDRASVYCGPHKSAVSWKQKRHLTVDASLLHVNDLLTRGSQCIDCIAPLCMPQEIILIIWWTATRTRLSANAQPV